LSSFRRHLIGVWSSVSSFVAVWSASGRRLVVV